MGPATPTTTTGPPDFVGVGAQRAGTTWWFRLLARHPQVRAPRGRIKELHFFERFVLREMEDADVAAYHELFPRRPGQVAGEWSPLYMSDYWIPPLLERAAPGAKLLVLLRDPVERFRSGVVHHFVKDPGRLAHVGTADAIDRGRYATQLERLWRFVPRERTLVLQYERCRADVPGEYARTLRFLGVDDTHAPEEPERPRGTTTEKAELPAHLRATLQRELEPEVARLRALVPDLDLALWPAFDHLADA